MLLVLANTLNLWSNIRELYRFLIVLTLVVLMNILLFSEIKMIYLALSALTLLAGSFVFEYFQSYRNVRLDFFKDRYTLLAIVSILLYPIVEELVFRYFLYQHFMSLGFPILYYFLVSSLSFTVTHMFHQGTKSIYKIVFALGQSILFWYSQEILLCIIVHMCFNVFVYFDKMSRINKYT